MIGTISLKEILGLSLVREALKAATKENKETAFKKRLELLDGIGKAHEEMRTADNELTAARRKFEDATEAMQKERGRLGAIEGRKSSASRKYNQLLKDLRDYGEREINDALLMIDCALTGTKEEIRAWENARKIANPTERSGKMAKAADLLPDLRESLVKLEKAREQIGKLSMARKSPEEVIEQSRAVLEMAGLKQ